MKGIYLSVLAMATLMPGAGAQISNPPEVQQKPGNDEIITFAEQMPEFPGKPDSLYEFLSANTRYPPAMKLNRIEGRSVVQCIIEKDGQVSNIRIARSLNKDADAEVLRLMSIMPAWKPGKQNGKPVRVSITLPIIFKLD